MAKAAPALTFTRASLAETLAQVEEFVRQYGSLASVADRIVELEAEKQERADEVAALTRERDELRASNDELRAQKSEGVAPDTLLRFLKRRVYCVGDLDKLRPLLVECQREQRQVSDGKESAATAVDTGASADQASMHGVLMMTLQELTPAAAPALAPLFAANSPPPSPTVAVATAPLPAPTVSSAVATSPATSLSVKCEKLPVRSLAGGVKGQEDEGEATVDDADKHEDAAQHAEKGEEQIVADSKASNNEEEEEKPSGRTRGPTKRQRGVPRWTKQKRSASLKRSPTPPPRRASPARRGRPPSHAKTVVNNAMVKKVEKEEKEEETQERPAKRVRKAQEVHPRHVLQWPQPSNEQADGVGGKGDSAPAFQMLDFRVVASLEQTKPWDTMCTHRTSWLRVPDLAYASVAKWATRCLRAQYVRRQAYWERLHWLPESSCKGVQWEKYKVARQERAALADREWKSLYTESIRLMADDLLPEDVWCDPALWPLPEKPVLLLPKSVDLHAQIRLVDSNEPIRLYFVNALTNHPFFSEGLAMTYPTKQPAPRVGGEESPEAQSENEANKWRQGKRGKRGAKALGTKENGGLVKVNAVAKEESEPEAE